MPSPAWHFLHAAPPHYTTLKLSPAEGIVVDGKLDESAWSVAGVEWTQDMVDITSHFRRPELDRVNASLQARAKFRWSDEFLYVGIELREPFIFANITGHNGPHPPYHDNDVELFFDPSGSTQYYKEFELSARNATYDVLWGVPDGEGLACLKSAPSAAAAPGLQVPVCVNTSFPGYAGSWTMATRQRGALGGLLTATHYSPHDYGRYVAPYAVWTAELRFPLHAESGSGDAWHGGLLDAGFPYPGRAFPGADPALQHASGRGPTYWHFDLSRAEHPRRYTPPPPHAAAPSAANDVFCPLGCAEHNLSGWTADLSPPSKAECAEVRARWPTLLGTDPWDCYWEWALANVGANAYMHRPLYWATLQFAEAPAVVQSVQTGATPRAELPPAKNATCGQLAWPGRYLARLISIAQREVRKPPGRGYTGDPDELVRACRRVEGCSAADLAYALSLPERFTIELSLESSVQAGAPSPHAMPNDTEAAIGGVEWALEPPPQLPPSPLKCELPPPCYAARVHVHGDDYAYATTIDSNSKVVTTFSTGSEQHCLFVSSRNSLRPAET
jgi:hypothetical protein